MATIPAGTKFIGIGASVPTPENKSSQNNGFQEVYTIEDIQKSVVTETIVDISSAMILDLGNTPVSTLPVLPSRQYYTGSVIMEFYPGTTPYTLPSGATEIRFLIVIGIEHILATFDASPLVDGLYSVSTKSLNYDNVDNSFSEAEIEIISVTDLGEQSLEDGDGTIRLIFETKTRTFGA